MLNIPLGLRLLLIFGALCYLGVILLLLKRKKLNVQYSIIWLASAVVLLLFAVFPYLVAVLRDILNIEMPVNLVFALLFVFVLLLLLSLSTIVTGFAAAIKRLTQTQALLEERIRRLEAAGKGGAGAEEGPPPGEAAEGRAGDAEGREDAGEGRAEAAEGHTAGDTEDLPADAAAHHKDSPMINGTPAEKPEGDA